MATHTSAQDLRWSLLTAAICAIAKGLNEAQRHQVHDALLAWGRNLPERCISEGVDASLAAELTLMLGAVTSNELLLTPAGASR